jgi:hypothetical protein
MTTDHDGPPIENVEQAIARINELTVEIARLTDGADPSPPDESERLTYGQWIHQFNQFTGADRRHLVRHLYEVADHAMACHAERHAAQIGELSERPTQHAYEAACEALEKRRVALVQALPIAADTSFYDAVDLVRHQLQAGEQAVSIHHTSAMPDNWQHQIKTLVMDAWATAGIGAEGLATKLTDLIQHWENIGKVHTCEAHCTLPHVAEHETPDATPQLFDTVVGSERCCHRREPRR